MTRELSGLRRALRWVLGACAAVAAVSFVCTSLMRATYPFEIEWLEGGSVDHVRWLLAGHKLYGRPNVEFVPYIYTPLYYYVGAALSWCLGLSLSALRLTSIAATLGTAGLLYKLVAHETSDRLAAFAAAGFYLGAYRLSGFWFDVARVDSLCVLLVTAAIYASRTGRTPGAAAVAGVFVSLAFLTKQVALPIALPIALYLLARSSLRNLLVFLSAIAVVAGGGALWLEWFHDGWFSYYAFTLPSNHAVRWSDLAGFVAADLPRLAPLVLLLAASGWFAWRGARLSADAVWFYAPLAATLLGVSVVARVHEGGYPNSWMPMFVGLAVFLGLALHGLRETAPRLEVAAYALGVLQLVALFYAPWRQVPSAEDRRQGQAFIDVLRSLPGDVYVFDHGYYGSLAGKRTFVQASALTDVVRGDPRPAQNELLTELDDAVTKQRFGAIVIGASVPRGSDVPESEWTKGLYVPDGFVEALERYYVPQAHLYEGTDAFLPLVGWRRRPSVVYVPRSSDAR